MKQFSYYRFQLIAVTLNTLVGVQSMYIPRLIAASGGSAGWLCTVLSGVLATLVFVLVSRVSRPLPGTSYISHLHSTLGMVVTPFFVLPVLAAEFIVLSLSIRIFGELVGEVLLPTTPADCVIIGMLLLLAYFCGHGPRTFARVNELFLIPIVLLTLGTDLLALGHAGLSNLRFLPNSRAALFSGIYHALCAYAGAGVVLYLTHYVKDPAELDSASLIAGFAATSIYTGFMLECLLVLGANLTAMSTWPTLKCMTSVRLPALFLEKVDSVFAAGWLLSVFTTSGNMMFVISRSLGELLGLRDSRMLVPAMIPWVYLAAMLPGKLERAEALMGAAAVAELAAVTLASTACLATASGRRSVHK